MIRLLIVDDQPLIRAAIVSLIDDADDIEVVGEAADGADALALAASLAPDVVLMDIRMPRMDGIAATTAIGADPALAAVHVLILTTFEEDENLFAALRAGAGGFIGKAAEPEQILQAIRAVHAGESLLSPRATRTLIERYLQAPAVAPAPVVEALTVRESEVLVLVARGRSNAEIADELFISPLTAKTHVNRIMSKLGARDRAQLVVFAYESGYLRGR